MTKKRSTHNRAAEIGFGGWGAGGRRAGAGDEAARHLSRTSRNHRTHRLVALRTIHRFCFRRQDHPYLGRQRRIYAQGVTQHSPG